jgi:hypothetical protein
MALQISKGPRSKASPQQSIGARHDLLLEQVGQTAAAVRTPVFTHLPPSGTTPPAPNPLPDISQ